MSFYTEYLAEIEERKASGLSPKPIEDGALVSELIAQISDTAMNIVTVPAISSFTTRCPAQRAQLL